MLITGNGVTIAVEDEDDFTDDLLRWLFSSDTDTVEDDIAEHALDIVCFLQDEDVYTPMDAAVEKPFMITLADFDIECR